VNKSNFHIVCFAIGNTCVAFTVLVVTFGFFSLLLIPIVYMAADNIEMSFIDVWLGCGGLVSFLVFIILFISIIIDCLRALYRWAKS
jgi:hypothetical protein